MPVDFVDIRELCCSYVSDKELKEKRSRCIKTILRKKWDEGTNKAVLQTLEDSSKRDSSEVNFDDTSHHKNQRKIRSPEYRKNIDRKTGF